MQNRIYFIIGKSGSGKSWLARWLAIQYLKKGLTEYIVVLDTSADHFYSGLQDWNFKLWSYDNALAQKKINWTKVFNQYPKSVIEISFLTDEEITNLVDDVSLSIMELGNTLLLIDEAHQFYPRTGYHSKNLERLIRGGRKIGVDLIFVTQMRVDVDLVAVKQANVVISFQVTEENDVEKVSRLLGESKEKITSLKQRQCLVKDTLQFKSFILNTQTLDSYKKEAKI